MKKQIFKLLCLLILIGCNNLDYKPKYKDFENAWERENLIGKVRKIAQYKANVTDFETGKADKPIIQFKKEFSQIGNISYQEYFDEFGELKQYIRNKYDVNGFRIESISENFKMPMKSIEKAVFDTITKKQISVHMIYNDTLEFDAFSKYDNHGNLIEVINIKNGDTTSGCFEYKYDKEAKIIFKKQIDKSEYGVIVTTNEFNYNSKGNLVELISMIPPTIWTES